MQWYKTGTVSVTNGSKVITGIGTSFITIAGVTSGDAFTLDGSKFYEIATVDSETQVTLVENYAEATQSDQSYAIDRRSSNSLSNDALAARVAQRFTEWQQFVDQVNDWKAGVVDGGPNSDGEYPLTDPLGVEHLLPCPAKISAEVDAHEELIGTSVHGLGTASTATVTTSSTDITTGRVLKVGDFGVGVRVELAAGTDLNTITQEGEYCMYHFNGTINTPAFSNGEALVISVKKYDPTRLVQTLRTCRYSFRTFERAYLLNTDSWTPWREIYHTGNILGTVSQSAGVPTGAIIERGSNSNGEYVKFADGTLFCSATVITTGLGDFGAGTLADMYRTNPATWSFPHAFIANPTVQLTIKGTSGGSTGTNAPISCRHYVTSISTTSSGGIQAVGGVNSGYDVYLYAFAIGRWY